MNKKLTLFSLTIVFAFLSLQAQTLNAPSFLSGDSYTMAVVTNVEPGEAGENMTWDYSGVLFEGSYNGQFVPSSPSPYEDDYPNADWILESGGNQFYYNYGPDFFEYHGGAEQGVSYPYTDPETYHPYPFSFGETFEDNMAATVNIAGIETNRTGASSTTFDGYGAIDLPGGDHLEHISRLRCNRAITDSSITGVTSYTIDQIWFFQNGLLSPVVTHTDVVIETPEGNDHLVFTEHLQSYTVATDEIEVELDFAMFPNPARDFINLKYQHSPELIEIRDVIGRLVIETSPIQGLPVHRINTSNLSHGIYSVTLIEGSTSTTQKLVVE
jgi:hypothetical protein